jgi:glutamate/tyrosine decarboxylase-like PLP-dependent enzyme
MRIHESIPLSSDVLKLPAGSAGAFVTGATVANFTALAAARHRVLARAGWDVEAEGLFGAPPITVVVGDEAHNEAAQTTERLPRQAT